MPQRTDLFDLGRLGLTSGEGRRLDLFVHVEPVRLRRLDATPSSRSSCPCASTSPAPPANGWALRLRFSATLDGPCMRCLEPATPTFEVDAYEVHQPGGGRRS